MFRNLSFPQGLLWLTLFLSGAGIAAEYTIDTDLDTVADDDKCSLREAVQAINTRSAVDTCPAGGGSDLIFLEPGKTYALVSELVVGGSTDGEGVAVDPAVSVLPVRDNSFDEAVRDNPVLIAADGHRVFNLVSGASLTLKNLTLRGGATAVSGNGGLVRAEGQLTLARRMILEQGKAEAGGAVYLIGDRNFSFDLVRFSDNEAQTTVGGAIASDVTYEGQINGSFFYFSGNTAATGGGAINFDGASGPGLSLVNGTFYDNDAGAGTGSAIALVAATRDTDLNNLTIAGNGSGGALAFSAVSGSAEDILTNSVIVGNQGGSCVGDAAAVSGALMAYLVHDGSVGLCPLDSDAAAVVYELPGNSSSSADFSVLNGVVDPGGAATEGDCPALLGASACGPREYPNSWPGFGPSLYASAPTVVDAASPESSVTLTCYSTDTRSLPRSGRCDAGALELQVAKGAKDEFNVLAGASALIDVAANDVGDVQLTCALPDCISFDQLPSHGTVSVELDGAGYPQVRYQSAPGFRGVDVFRYRIAQSAFENNLTYADADVASQSNIVVTSESGIEHDSIGSFGPVLMFLLGLAAVRRGSRGAPVLLLLLASVQAGAADIRVNSLLDSLSPVRGDGLCTLREALDNATDESPFYSPDCVAGSTGRDTVFVPEGVILLAGPLEVRESIVTVEGVGAYVDGDGDITNDSPSATPATVIDGAGSTVLFDASSPLTLRYLTLRNGASSSLQAGGGAIVARGNLTLAYVSLLNNVAVNGGAVYLQYNLDEAHRLQVTRAEFDSNSATENGGAISMLGQNQIHEIVIADSSFIGNSAGARGGALDINLARGGSLRVINSTFSGNSAPTGGSIDLADIAASSFVVGSTFLGNGANSIELGVTQPSGSIRITNSIFGDTGPCAAGAAVRFNSSVYNLFASPQDATCAGTIENNNATIAPADLSAVLDGGVLTKASGEKEAFVPSHFQVAPGAASAGLVIDAGNPDELVYDTDSPERCRVEDLRGESRLAGGRCDRGAYEVQVATAVDDRDTSKGFKGRYVVLDVLKNDLPGDGGTIVKNSLDVDVLVAGQNTSGTATGGGTVTVVKRSDGATACEVAPATDDCVIRYEPPLLNCDQVKEFSDTFSYHFTVSPSNQISTDATVTVDIANAAPYAEDVTRRAVAGEPVVFPFAPDDYDPYVPNTPVIDNIKLEQDPILAKSVTVNGEKQILGVGVVVDLAAGTVTYYPKDITKTFDDRFTLSYQDECGAVGKTSFTVDYDNEEVGGGIGGGSVGFLWLLLGLGLCGLRRAPR